MKQILLASAISIAASTAFAGGYSDPVVTPEAVITDPVVTPEAVITDTVETAGSDDWVIALMTFLTIVVAGMQ